MLAAAAAEGWNLADTFRAGVFIMGSLIIGESFALMFIYGYRLLHPEVDPTKDGKRLRRVADEYRARTLVRIGCVGMTAGWMYEAWLRIGMSVGWRVWVIVPSMAVDATGLVWLMFQDWPYRNDPTRRTRLPE